MTTQSDYEYELTDESPAVDANLYLEQRKAQILADIRSKQAQAREVYSTREITQESTESTIFSPQAREVYKDKKIERQKDISRSLIASEERNEILTSSGIGGTANPTAKASDNSSLTFGNEHEPARTTSRALTGITAQQAICKTGIKVSINIQTEAAAEHGAIISITAELKRADRIRELKPYEHDSEEFAVIYEMAKDEIRQFDKEDKKTICIGRVHIRAKRDSWIPDTFAIGKMDEVGIIQQLYFYYETEIYEIAMNEKLSSGQSQHYQASGIYGSIVKSKRPPGLLDMEWKRI